jgi:DNA-binding transcriptional ArsR family regulator
MSDAPGEKDGDEKDEEADRIPDSVKQNLLDHPLRRAIVDLLADRPGMNKNQICEELDMDGHHLDHHLDQLETRGRLVVTRESAQDKEVLCFLAEDEELWEDENTRILFGRRQKRAVGLLLADKPGVSTREIAEELMLSPDTVRYHLRTLMAHDLVERYPSGQTNLYEPAEALVQWAREVGDGFDRPWEE